MKLSKDKNGVNVDQSLYRSMIELYRSMIGNLIYLTTSRPNITFVIGVCPRYQAIPKASYLNQVKRIMKYINEARDYGIFYSHDTNSILVGYWDADWVRSVDDRKSA